MTLQQRLLGWFDAHRRDLPWRRTRDAYAIWLSEVMLQQTQVATVIPYWQRFLAQFPTLKALAEAPLSSVLTLWSGLGYYSRARHLHVAAQRVMAAHGGTFPQTVVELLKLPGFGRYTAGAVASIAYGQRAPLVDGNVGRVFSRLFMLKGAPGDKAWEKALWLKAEELVPPERPGDFNQALMELGATVCTKGAPSCSACPLTRHCAAYKAQRVSEFPSVRVRPARKSLTLAVAVCRRGELLLLARREERGLFGGLWELPSVEAAGGDALAALLGKSARVGAALGTVRRTLTHRDLELRLYEVQLGKAAAPSRAGYVEWKWAEASDAKSLGISAATRAVLRALEPPNRVKCRHETSETEARRAPEERAPELCPKAQ